MSRKIKYVLLGIGVLLFLSFILEMSYAYWKFSNYQNDFNVAGVSCFDLTLTNESEGITLEKVYPITDEEGLALTGYTFTIKNVCDTYAYYQVNLEDIYDNISKRLSNNYIKVSLNNGTPKVLSTYENVDVTLDNSDESFKLTTGSLAPEESVTYNLKLWMDEDTSAIDEVMNATFLSRVTIVASYIDEDFLENTIAINFEELTTEYTNVSEFVLITAQSKNYNIIAYSEDGIVWTSLENADKTITLTKEYVEEKNTIYFKDEIGNIESKTIILNYLDTISPIGNLNVTGTIVDIGDKAIIKANISNVIEEKSGIKEYQYSLDNETWISSTSDSNTFYDIPIGSYTIYTKIIDNAENETLLTKNITIEAVAQINNTKYISLQSAFDAVATNNVETEVILLKDTEEEVIIQEGKKITLNIQNYTISSSALTLKNNGIVTLKSSSEVGTIKNNSEEKHVVQNNGELTLESANILQEKVDSSVSVLENYGTFIMTEGTITSNTIAITNYGTATLSGGSITNTGTSGSTIWNVKGALNLEGSIQISGNESSTYSVIQNGSSSSTEAILNINGGTIEGKYSIGNNGTFIMTEGTITSSTRAIDNYGTATLSGGSITNTGTSSSTILNYNVLTIDGSIQITNENVTPYSVILNGISTNYEDAILTIRGGSIKGAGILLNVGRAYINGEAILEQLNDSTISISTIQNGVTNDDDTVEDTGASLTITGGKIISNYSSALRNLSFGTVVLSGGIIQTENYYAFVNYGVGTINGTTKIQNNSSNYATIYNKGTLDMLDTEYVTIENLQGGNTIYDLS